MAAPTAALSPVQPTLRLSELISALSLALDMTEGQPPGHCVRVCWIGMHVGAQMGLSQDELWELYYTLLLKDLGCSSNAARICELYLADDLALKSEFKLLDGSLPQALRFVLRHTGANAPLRKRVGAVLNILKNGGDIVREVIDTRCHRGAEIARRLRFPEGVAQGIQHLDEHWDGGGHPTGAKADAIPVYARIALLAQIADVFHTTGGPAAAMVEVGRRSGRWFDPAAVEAFKRAAAGPLFWSRLASDDLREALAQLEPAQTHIEVNEAYLDDLAEAFGQVVDAKSPYTAGHSARVALYAERIAERMGLPEPRRRWLYRAALLHDIGKLGVSSAILDKPGKLDIDEFTAIQAHATHTYSILSRIEVFDEMASVAAAHHERLDGKGYPLGLGADQISLETRIITVADFFDALTADRPYRGAMPTADALEIMAKGIGGVIDPAVFEVLKAVVGDEAA